jgi:ketosteroid isomerase-like protein
MKKSTLFLPALLLFAGCTTTPKVDLAAEADAVRNLENQMTVAYQNRSFEELLIFMAPDVVHIVPDFPPITGIENSRARLEPEFADTAYIWETYSMNIDFVEVSTSGDMAYVRGTDLLKKKTPEGIVDDPAKWVDIWKKIDGQWKVVLNIWNR